MNGFTSTLEQKMGWAVILALFAVCALMLRPFVAVLLWSMILCASLWPLHVRLLRGLNGRRTLASLVLCLGFAILVLLPFALIGLRVAENVDSLRTVAHRWMSDGLPDLPGWVRGLPLIGEPLNQRWEDLGHDGARRLIEQAAKGLLVLGMALGNGLGRLTLSVFIAFFWFQQGQALADRASRAVRRIGGERGHLLLRSALTTVRGVVYGILGTALLQAVLAGAGYFLAGVPGAGLLTLLTFFLSVVPGGPLVIAAGAAVWLFGQGSTGWGVFMVLWGLGVSSVDNFVRPWLISQGSDLPFLLIFLGVLGGAMTFGFIGVFLGPTLMSLAFRLVKEWDIAGRATLPGAALSPDPGPV